MRGLAPRLRPRPAPSRAAAAALAASLALSAASGADAADPKTRSVVVSPPPCDSYPFRLTELLDSLRVELVPTGLACCSLDDSRARPAPRTIHVTIEQVPCGPGASLVQVSAERASDSRELKRDVLLGDVAQTVRARALALAVAELIRSLESSPVPVEARDASAEPPPPPSPSGTSPANPARELPAAVEETHPVAWSARAEAEVRILPARDTTTWGARAGFGARWRALQAAADGGAAFASARGELGQVRLQTVTVGLELGPHLATPALLVDLGARAELGVGSIRGEPARSDVRAGSGSDLVAALGVRTALELLPHALLRPRMVLEGGGVLSGVNGEMGGQPLLGMTGSYLLAALGLAVSL